MQSYHQFIQMMHSYGLLTISASKAGLPSAVIYGPVWLDSSLLVTLFARQNITSMLIGFRLIGLAAHLINALLFWTLLSKIKPELRISSTLLYAWNPLVLVLGVSQMHLDIVLVLLLLLAMVFFERDSLLLCWVFVLLAVLVNILFLPLLPLCLFLIGHKLRFIHVGIRWLWYAAMVAISALVLVLSYAPYWEPMGFGGSTCGVCPDILAAECHQFARCGTPQICPLQWPAPVLWVITPAHWAIGVLIIVSAFLLFSLWLANTLELALFCASWLTLLLILLLPAYWPWYLIVPLALALGSTNRGTAFLSILLSLGALLCYYWWQYANVWEGQALSTIGLPLVIWGWVEFFYFCMAHDSSNVAA